MTQAPVRQEVFRVSDGDVIITFPADISRRCIGDLKAQFDTFIEKLCCPNDADREAFLRGLAELAAYDAVRARGETHQRRLSRTLSTRRTLKRTPGRN